MCVTFNVCDICRGNRLDQKVRLCELCNQKAALKSSLFPVQSQPWHNRIPPQPPVRLRSHFQQVNRRQKKGKEKKRTTSGRGSKINTFLEPHIAEFSMLHFSDGTLCGALWTACQHSARVGKGKSFLDVSLFAVNQHIFLGERWRKFWGGWLEDRNALKEINKVQSEDEVKF